MATTAPSSRRINAEGRMSLRDHLTELRRRVTRAALAILAGAIAGWFLYPRVYLYLTEPILRLQQQGHNITVNFGQVGAAFDLRLKMSVFIGILIASPVWLYQLWAFITPGLTSKERRYALGFVSAAVPLFLAGAYLASLFIPNAVDFLTAFTPKGGSNIFQAQDYLGFLMRTVLAFGAAFLLPVVLVALNFSGLLPGKAVLKAWRWVTVSVFVFAAAATPTPDVTSMFLLALPMLALFAIAIVICLLNDRRKARIAPEWGLGLSDDEASSL